MRIVPSIITVTLNPSLDRFISVDALRPDIKMRCRNEKVEAGGGGINISRILGKLGTHSDAVVSVGGFTGARIEQIIKLEGFGVHAHRLPFDSRENIVIRDLSKGEEFKLIDEGPVHEPIDLRHIQEIILQLMKPGALVAISGSMPPGIAADEFFLDLGRALRPWQPLVFVDTAGPGLESALKSGVYLIKPNLSELESLAGRELKTSAEQNEFARSLVRDGKAQKVLLSLGDKGATLVSKDSVAYFPSPRVQAVSTVGAGDSLLAGTLFKVQRGDSLEKAVHFGVRCGAAAVSTQNSSSFSLDNLQALTGNGEAEAVMGQVAKPRAILAAFATAGSRVPFSDHASGKSPLIIGPSAET